MDVPPDPPLRERPRSYRLLFAGVVALAAVSTAAIVATSPLAGHDLTGGLVMLGLFAAAEAGMLWDSDSSDYTLTMGEVYALPLLVLGGAPLALGGSLAIWATSEALMHRKRKRGWYRTPYNLSNIGLFLASAWLLWTLWGRPVELTEALPLVFAAFVLGSAVATVIVVSEMRAGGEDLSWLRSRAYLHECLMQFGILPLFGVIAVILYAHHPVDAFLMLGPIVAIRYAVSQGQQRRSAVERLGIDPLTGLANHQRFWERLDTELGSGRPFGLVLCDIDRFKQLNDRHGHLAGDEALVAVAGALAGAVRDSDLACRYGGEEFALLLPGATAAEAAAVAERARAACSASHALSPTASFGVAAFPADAREARALVGAADAALYRAKAAGRDRVELAGGAAAARAAA